jgi:hypothetical protein
MSMSLQPFFLLICDPVVQRKVGDSFFPELRVYISVSYNIPTSDKDSGSP